MCNSNHLVSVADYIKFFSRNGVDARVYEKKHGKIVVVLNNKNELSEYLWNTVEERKVAGYWIEWKHRKFFQRPFSGVVVFGFRERHWWKFWKRN